MRKPWLAGLGWGVLGVFVVATLLWTVSRLRGPSPAQRAAMAQLSTLPPLQGRNAFQVLWQLPYAIPEAQRDAVFAEDVRRWKALASGPGTVDEPPSVVPESAAAGRYPPSLTEADRARFCRRGANCLSSVEADPASYTDVVARHAALLDRIESLSGHAGIRDPFGYPAVMPLARMNASGLPATRYAVAFVQGDRDGAFEGTCRAIDTWRRLGANSDTLAARLFSAASVRATYAELFLDMLARVPRDYPLPALCIQAFAPPSPREASLCDAARGEFAYKRSVAAWASRRGTRGLERAWDALILDEDMLLGELAMPLAGFCSPGLAQRIRDDVRIGPDAASPGFKRLECVSDAAGCILGAISESDNDFADQIQDTNARLRLVALLLEMRSDATDARPILARLEARHAAFGATSRRLRLIDGGRSLCLDNYRKRPSDCWKILLPPYFAMPVPDVPPSP